MAEGGHHPINALYHQPLTPNQAPFDTNRPSIAQCIADW